MTAELMKTNARDAAGSSCGQQTTQGACVSNRAVQDRGRRLNQSHFRPMAEVSFLPSANTRKRASASRENVKLLTVQNLDSFQAMSLDYWPFLDFGSALLLPTDEPTINTFKLPCFSEAKVPLAHLQQNGPFLWMPFCFWLGIRLGPSFRCTPLTIRHCRHNRNLSRKACLSGRLPNLRNLVNGKL